MEDYLTKEVEIDFDIDYNKRQKKKFAIRVLLVTLLLLFVCFIVFILFSSKSKLASISIVANEYIDDSDIIKYAKINEGDSLVKVYLTEVAENILLHEGIKDVDVFYDSYNEIVIEVVEEPILFRTYDNVYIASGEKTNTVTLYPAILFDNFEDANKKSLIIDELIELEEYSPEVYEFISQISHVPDVFNDDRLVFVMRDSNRVYVNPEDIQRVLKRYFKIVDSIYSEYGFVYGEMDMDKSGEFRPYE